MDDSLTEVINIIVQAEVHRLIVVDKEQRVAGIISLSDILKHLVLELPEHNIDVPKSPVGVIFKGGDSNTDIESTN